MTFVELLWRDFQMHTVVYVLGFSTVHVNGMNKSTFVVWELWTEQGERRIPTNNALPVLVGREFTTVSTRVI
jgi:hypothetical protein